MMSEWKTYKLSELVEIKYGKDHKHLADGVIPVYGSGGIMRFAETHLYDRESILIPRKGTLSNLFYLDKPFWSVDTMFYTKIKNGVHGKYLYYLLKSMDLASMNVGSAVPSLTTEVLNKVEISLPDLPTQRQIAQILSSLDDKIELNLQMNQTLEAMAQAIFKEWFVDFNFPGFDGELVDGLPKGWRIVELSSLISVKDGTHDSPKQQQEGKYLITSKHLKNHFIDFSSAYKISDDDFNKVNKRSKVDRLDILITMIGTVGNLYFVHENEIDFAIKNIGLFKASERPDLAYFLYFTIDSKETSEYFTKRLAGSTQQYLTLETLRQTPILLPDDETLNSFNEYAKTIYERIDINSQNIHSLTQTRDTLLPKLMSGNIAVMNT
ncbi:type I restriction enzyme, S subunit [Porphyromonadaceae bacterium NLAE-zl-C104]|nr:type I restriction enzyme, S subunit [Porphyromonadaceae bacterium NLAE-zl-C104]